MLKTLTPLPLLVVVLLGCAKTPTTILNACTGDQICAYDGGNTPLGLVINHHKIDSTKSQTQILSRGAGGEVHIFINEKSQELDPLYKTTKLVASSWPFTLNDPSEYFGVVVPTDLGEAEGKIISVNFTTTPDGGFISPQRICYQYTNHDPPMGISLTEYSWDDLDPSNPNVFMYDSSHVSQLISDKTISAKPCTKEQTGLPDHITPPVVLRNALGMPYNGEVTNSVCPSGTLNCIGREG